jgi:hypothetical protein
LDRRGMSNSSLPRGGGQGHCNLLEMQHRS